MTWLIGTLKMHFYAELSRTMSVIAVSYTCCVVARSPLRPVQVKEQLIFQHLYVGGIEY